MWFFFWYLLSISPTFQSNPVYKNIQHQASESDQGKIQTKQSIVAPFYMKMKRIISETLEYVNEDIVYFILQFTPNKSINYVYTKE